MGIVWLYKGKSASRHNVKASRVGVMDDSRPQVLVSQSAGMQNIISGIL
jgi:hypothetical protein